MFEQLITRHAILNETLTVLGYDLVIGPSQRGLEQPAAAALAADAATMVFSWEALVGTTLAFVRVDTQELLSGAALLLPRNRTVIDIPPTVTPTAEIIVAAQELKNAGYRLSLSGWRAEKDRRALAVLSDYLRADIHALEPAGRSGNESGPHSYQATLVAQNLNTWEDHQAACRLGFAAFQGDFFLKPQLFRRREVAGTRLNALRLLQAILKDPLDLAEIESIVRQEPAIAYKLLRYLNSPVMERPVEVRSIRNAVALLGDQEFRRWASLVAVVTPAIEKTEEVMRIALTRAYFCEQIARRSDARFPYDFFFTGLFSVMDAVLDRPLPEIACELALPPNVRGALLGEAGVLHDALQAAVAYERGAWARLTGIMARIPLPESCAAESFRTASTTAGAILA